MLDQVQGSDPGMTDVSVHSKGGRWSFPAQSTTVPNISKKVSAESPSIPST